MYSNIKSIVIFKRMKIIPNPVNDILDKIMRSFIELYQVEMLQDMGEGLDNILRWRSKPVSLFSMIIFVLFVYYIELWMVPLSLGMLLLWNVRVIISTFTVLGIFNDY